jgi:hypothetical protein
MIVVRPLAGAAPQAPTTLDRGSQSTVGPPRYSRVRSTHQTSIKPKAVIASLTTKAGILI